MPDLDDLSLDALWALLGAMTDLDAAPVGALDPAVRARARALDLGAYVADPAECASRTVVLDDGGHAPLALDEAPPELLPEEDRDGLVVTPWP